MRELTITASKRLVVGGLLWASLVQMFVVNNLIVLPRATNQNLVHEIISALGVTRCGHVGGVRFCSPLHEDANVAWIIGGVCLTAGALLNTAIVSPGRVRNLAFGALALSGLGLLSSGFNPYNLRPALHLLSAGTCFFSGGVGALLLGGLIRRAHRPLWGALGVACGVTTLVFTVLTGLRPDPGVQGLFERTSAWPTVVWIIGSGATIALQAWRSSRTSGR
ncbi:hypothetical protein OG389_03150 [Streptomyces sp. NBC_00435]|uniref:hypothetical protein n=1 Tax=Streptomyces sp. NBC_00435 TaxID=2903649 RepID=UPI002E224395